MNSYNGTFQISRRVDADDDLIDDLMDRLAGHHPAVGSYDGRLGVTISYPAEDFRQALSVGLAAVEEALPDGITVTSAEIMTTAEFDDRHGLRSVHSV